MSAREEIQSELISFVHVNDDLQSVCLERAMWSGSCVVRTDSASDMDTSLRPDVNSRK